MKQAGDFKNDPHYQSVQAFYGDRRALRSGVMYMQHIDDGLLVLANIEATLGACQAYCLHPIVQGDDALATAFQSGSVLYQFPISHYAMALVMEYRWVANGYLSKRTIHSLDEVKLSPLPDVQQMLVADKVQNRKDFERYHDNTHPRAAELDLYFRNWLAILQVSEAAYQDFVKMIDAAYPPEQI